MSKVKVLILTGYGLNCDNETAYAFELAGADAKRIHINDLISGGVGLDNFQILVFGGGFSWADDHGAGVIQAVRLKTNIGDHILEFIQKDNLVLGICNGFQTLSNMGLLPGFDKDYSHRSVALTFNDSGNFRNDWVKLRVNQSSPCIFTKGIKEMELPVRHGEGKFYADDQTILRLNSNDQIVIQYAGPDGKPANGKFPFNPNGSLFDIAGICDPTGRIFGLMPHPEAFNHYTNHPDWMRRKEHLKRSGKNIETGLTPGVQVFKNAIEFIEHR